MCYIFLCFRFYISPTNHLLLPVILFKLIKIPLWHFVTLEHEDSYWKTTWQKFTYTSIQLCCCSKCNLDKSFLSPIHQHWCIHYHLFFHCSDTVGCHSNSIQLVKKLLPFLTWGPCLNYRSLDYRTRLVIRKWIKYIRPYISEQTKQPGLIKVWSKLSRKYLHLHRCNTSMITCTRMHPPTPTHSTHPPTPIHTDTHAPTYPLPTHTFLTSSSELHQHDICHAVLSTAYTV